MTLEVLFSNIIHCAEIIVYSEWKHKLTSKVFIHLFNGNEVLRTVDNYSILIFVLLLVLECIIAGVLFWFLFKNHKSLLFIKNWKNGLFYFSALIIELGFCLLFARGGFQQIPINIDSSYYSRNYTQNDISINSTYFFINSYLLYLESDIEQFVPKIDSKEALIHANILYRKNDLKITPILEIKTPNIIVVILEGWSSSALSELQQRTAYQSKFQNLKKEGIYFENIYATNTTSEIGHTSILAGFPSLSEIAISQYPEKHRNLVTLNQILKKHGYSSNYIFGGDIKYGNIESFIVDHDFDEIRDEDDFPSYLNRGKLTYNDEDVFSEYLKVQKKRNSPFFSVIFTGSTHSPYDYPSNTLYNWNGKERAYMNSLIYAENALHDFIEKCKKEPWYNETLFVFISDHSHSSPKFEIPYNSEFFKIPCLFFGEPIKSNKKGSVISTIGSQADLPATLLNQLGYSSKKFPFSKDLTDFKAENFAMLSTIRGYGFVNKYGAFMYQFDYKKYHQNSFNKPNFSKAKKDSDALFRSYFDYFDNLDGLD